MKPVGFTKTIEEKLILEETPILRVNEKKAYIKIKDGQFSLQEHGLVVEPLSNAIDEQQGNDPIEIILESGGDGYHRLTYKDNGPGLTSENLLALHYIGRTTKRGKKNSIGRFGIGLIGAFNKDIGVKRVEIVSKVCGLPSLITYDPILFIED